jgi:CHAD domain-containing protein
MAKSVRSRTPAARSREEIAAGLENVLLKALDTRWEKIRKESHRVRRKYSEESVHDLRVASRRLIAVLETLKKVHNASAIRECRRRVKKLLDGLSPLRDLNVQRVRISALLDRYPQLKNFEKSLAAKESQTAGKVQKLLKHTSKLNRAVVHVRRHARKGTSSDEILKVIDERFQRVLALADRIDPSDTTTIHRLRLAFKKFRYTCEVARPIIRKRVSASRLDEFHEFQTMMGDIQDVEVLSERLSKWTAKNNQDEEMKPVFDELATERNRKIEAFIASAGRVREFWK